MNRWIQLLGVLGLSCAALVLPVDAQGIDMSGPAWAFHVIDDSLCGADGVKLGDVDRDGRMDVATGWEEGWLTRVYLNPGPTLSKGYWPAVTVGETPFVEDAVFADMDGDGALDVVTCSEGNRRTVDVHWAPPHCEELLDPNEWRQESLPQPAGRMQWMFAWPMQVDGRNGIDLIAGGKGKRGEVGWFEAPENARDLPAYRWHSISAAGWIMSIVRSDMDGDGDTDVVVTDRYGPLRGCRWLENPGHGPEQALPWKNHFIGASDKEVMSMDLADLDGDGLEDAIVAVADMKIFFLKRLDKTGTRWKQEVIPVDSIAGNPRAVRVSDVDADGKQELVLTTWNANGKHAVLYLEHEPTVDEKPWSLRQISGPDKGIKYDRIEMLDMDGDGDLDLLTSEESQAKCGMGVVWYENPLGEGGRGAAAEADKPRR